MSQFVLALDQGTTSSRAIVFDRRGRVVAMAQEEFRQILPQPGHVEHDPEDIWNTQLRTARAALDKAGLEPQQIAALGLTNQRETTLVWDRESGQPVSRAIVWQSRISDPWCQRLRKQGTQELFRQKTGLVLDPYFSATKLQYLLETVPGLRAEAEKGRVLFGTVDSFLLWRLTGGKVHATDPSNASRTLMFNIHTLRWDEELLKLLNVPPAMLPQVVPSSGVVGQCDPQWFGHPIPIAGIAGDQQAATFGQGCFRPGEAKNTYGTGCFLLMNTGSRPVASQHNLLTTVGWQLGSQVTYCLEGSVFVAGAVVQWLRDALGVISSSDEVEQLAQKVPDSAGVVFVPAFVGLGAPYWDPEARGLIVGLTRGTTAAHLARAALEAIAFQTWDLVHAMEQDSGEKLQSLKADGGASANDLLMQFQADLLGVPVLRPRVQETTALGAAYLAGLAVGYWKDQQELLHHWELQRQFVPQMDPSLRQRLLRRWHEAIHRCRQWSSTAEQPNQP